MSDANGTTFDEFWRLYAREHSRPATRYLHAVGTLLALALLAFAVASQRWWLLAAVLPVGYGPAWISHLAVERNRPLTFSHPWWSLRADFKMLALTLTGRMSREVARCEQAARNA